MNTTRRALIGALATAALLPRAATLMAAPKPLVEVWKSPTCGCCKDWVVHLEANGFAVKVYETGNNEARARLGMPAKFASCHTARVDGYLLEGHVPASEVQKMLKEKPNALGLAVPAMPVGSPGMDGPEYKGRKDPYDVLLVQADGNASIYRSFR